MEFAEECPACDSKNFVVLDIGAIAPFVAYRTGVDGSLGKSCECKHCFLRFCRVRFSDDEMARLYADYRGSSYNEERERFEPGYMAMFGHLNDKRDSIPFIEQWVESVTAAPSRVLDIGGNDGGNTPFSDRAEVTIMEVGDPEPEGKFDLVVMAHVLEHVPYPRRMVGYARSMLAPGGLVFAEVPIDPLVDGWHEHIQQFSRQSLVSLFPYVEDIRELSTSVGPVRMVLAK